DRTSDALALAGDRCAINTQAEIHPLPPRRTAGPRGTYRGTSFSGVRAGEQTQCRALARVCAGRGRCASVTSSHADAIRPFAAGGPQLPGPLRAVAGRSSRV